MKKLTSSIALTLFLFAGCGRGLDPDVNKGDADKAMKTALEAWQAGKTQTDLEKGQPSIIMNDDDWRTGKKLLDFKMEEGALSGRQVRCKVWIKLQDKNDKTEERNAVYIIDTKPRIVIVRDSFAT
jgi:hypothetical protein